MPKVPKTGCLDHFIGIDPGLSGGIVVIRRYSPEERFDSTTLIPMPRTELDLWSELRPLRGVTCVAMIEFVTPFNMGVSGAFTFGQGVGRLTMALTAAQIPFEFVTPVTWMRAMGVTPRKKAKKGPKKEGQGKRGGESKSQYKGRLRARAQQMFPKLPIWGENKGAQEKVCDALLIAEYCRRTHHQ